jgi:uncharacterized protein YuzB (UPF0349 family)
MRGNNTPVILKQEAVYKFIMSKIRNVDMRKEDCLTQCAQCAAALHMAVNLEKKE